MRSFRVFAGAVAAAMMAGGLALPGVAAAGTPYQAEATCPVDGKKFTWTSTGSYSTFGMELDGMPIGSWTFPMPLPQCPGSRFPVYRDFTPEEVTAIQALVMTPEYAAIKDEASYYVFGFVAARLEKDIPPLGSAWMLLKASWQVRDDPDRYGRYAAELIPAMDAAIGSLKDEDPAEWWGHQVILANVQRQSGDFDGAKARLDALPVTPPDSEGGDLVQRIAMTRRMIDAKDKSPASPPRGDD
ncbi:MAG: hypothetical protein ACT6RD_08265 [Brevundimonas sp.]|uniref:hypothetical protein n=1 Tax=Brevundimonas sp. TaxID=1871086 RepID=UPI0040343EE5